MNVLCQSALYNFEYFKSYNNYVYLVVGVVVGGGGILM